MTSEYYKESLEGLTGQVGIDIQFELGASPDPASQEQAAKMEAFINKPDIKSYLINMLLNEVCKLMNQDKHE